MHIGNHGNHVGRNHVDRFMYWTLIRSVFATINSIRLYLPTIYSEGTKCGGINGGGRFINNPVAATTFVASHRCTFRGNHLSNASCLRQVFFKCGESCSKFK